jgi:hypothetical protein
MPVKRRLLAAGVVAFTAGLVASVSLPPGTPGNGFSLGRPVEALPLYTARAGRTCDNCHADPTGWVDPALAQRKCNLSCLTCHLNPPGGGLRTVAGRYYAKATLPIFLSSHRPWEDRNRDVIPFLRSYDKRGNRLWDPAVGRPWGGTPTMAYDGQRYNGLRADPLFFFGIDTRYALWAPGGTVLVFPMQLDLHAAVHPYRHVTAYATAGVLAKAKGYGATFEAETPFMVKDTFILVHQLPYMSYLKLGRFIPPFGTYLADHTTPTRLDFELHQGLLFSRVTGIEVGLAPNYPYLNVALFRPNLRDRFPGDDPDYDATPPFLGVSGWGLAASAGWRDLGWQVGLSTMFRRRGAVDGGDTDAVALNWGLNPWHYLEWLPLTYLGELVYGVRHALAGNDRIGHIAAFHQLAALVRNGINLRLKYDWADPNTEIKDDHFHRLIVGTDLYFLPAVAFSAEFRMRFEQGEGRDNNGDAFLMVRGWY